MGIIMYCILPNFSCQCNVGRRLIYSRKLWGKLYINLKDMLSQLDSMDIKSTVHHCLPKTCFPTPSSIKYSIKCTIAPKL